MSRDRFLRALAACPPPSSPDAKALAASIDWMREKAELDMARKRDHVMRSQRPNENAIP